MLGLGLRDGNFCPPAGTWLGPTLMGRVLLGPMKNRVGYGFKKKKPEVGSGFIKKTQDPTRNPARIKTRYPEITKIPYIYIHTYNLTLIPYFFSSNSELSSLPPSVRHSLSLISTQSYTLTLPHPHSHTPTLPHASLLQSDTPSPSA